MTGEHRERFRAPGGVELHLTRFETGSRSVILAVPGIFMHRDSAEHRLLATRLAGLADVVSLDVRGHGDSGGAFSWGVNEPDDVGALVRQLRERYTRVLGVGFSFGGFHCAVAAGRAAEAGGGPLFEALALVSAPAHLLLLDHNPLTRGLLRSLPWMARRRRRFTRLAPRPPGREAPLRRVSALASTPLLIVHGADDWLVPYTHARRLYERAGGPRELVVVPGGLHAEYMLSAGPEALLDPLLAFLARFVEPRAGG